MLRKGTIYQRTVQIHSQTTNCFIRTYIGPMYKGIKLQPILVPNEGQAILLYAKQCNQIWRKFATLTKNLKFLAIFGGLSIECLAKFQTFINYYAIGQMFIVVIGQILVKNITSIWSHWCEGAVWQSRYTCSPYRAQVKTSYVERSELISCKRFQSN